MYAGHVREQRPWPRCRARIPAGVAIPQQVAKRGGAEGVFVGVGQMCAFLDSNAMVILAAVISFLIGLLITYR